MKLLRFVIGLFGIACLALALAAWKFGFQLPFHPYKVYIATGMVALLGLFAGTVYGRFHYLSDVVVGVAIGYFVYWVTVYFYPIKTEDTVTLKSKTPHFYSRLAQKY